MTIGALLVMGTVAALTQGPVGEMPIIVFALTGTTVPIAIGMAILRYHLFEIDRLVSRTISYGLISALLVAVFLLVNLGLQSLLSSVTSGNSLAVAGSTLLATGLFTPVRRRVQRSVDRRFNRARYDAEQTVAGFASRLRDEVDLPTLAGELDARRCDGSWRHRASACGCGVAADARVPSSFRPTNEADRGK